jgi:hypothetical protein
MFLFSEGILNGLHRWQSLSAKLHAVIPHQMKGKGKMSDTVIHKCGDNGQHPKYQSK